MNKIANLRIPKGTNVQDFYLGVRKCADALLGKDCIVISLRDMPYDRGTHYWIEIFEKGEF